MTSNSLAIVDREMAAPMIEGVDFGSRLWVIARSPSAVLVWVYSHSASINGFRHYYEPHLLILPDRTHRFMSRPEYTSLRHEWTRLDAMKLNQFRGEIEGVFGGGILPFMREAVQHKKTLIIEGGGGRLMPHPRLWGQAYADWIENPENGFLPRSEVAKGSRHKLGYREKIDA